MQRYFLKLSKACKGPPFTANRKSR